MQRRACFFCRDSSDQETIGEEDGRGTVQSLRLQVFEKEHLVLAQTATQNRGDQRRVLLQRMRVQDEQKVVFVLAYKEEAQGGEIVRQRRPAAIVLLQPVRLQEQEQVRIEGPRGQEAHGRLQVLVRDLRKEIQSER